MSANGRIPTAMTRALLDEELPVLRTTTPTLRFALRHNDEIVIVGPEGARTFVWLPNRGQRRNRNRNRNKGYYSSSRRRPAAPVRGSPHTNCRGAAIPRRRLRALAAGLASALAAGRLGRHWRAGALAEGLKNPRGHGRGRACPRTR